MIDISVIELFQKFGPLAGVILFFIWRDWKREDQLTKRIDTLEIYQKDTLSGLIESTTRVLANNTAFFKILITAFRDTSCATAVQLPESLDEQS